MKPQALEVFKIFEKAHGKRGAKVIVEYLENADTMAIEREINNKIEHLATKDDLFATREDLLRAIGSIRNDLTRETGSVRSDLTREIGSAREDLTREIANVRVDLTKSIYIVGVVQFLAMVGAVLAIISFLLK